MGHYDSSRDGYCGKCGAAPGNMIKGLCEFCDRAKIKARERANVEPVKKDKFTALTTLVADAQVEANTSFVFENVEVVKTGRKSQRKLTSGKVDELVEIVPADPINGRAKKWVQQHQLYEIVN